MNTFLCRYNLSQITVSMNSSPTSLIVRRVPTLIGQYLPPISPDHDGGPALNQHWFICRQLQYTIHGAVSKRERVKPCQAYRLAGGGPRVVVSTAAFHARVRGSVPGFGGLKETKSILCLEDSVISIISPSSGGSPGPV